MSSSLDDFGGWPSILGTLQANAHLSADQTEAVLGTILSGEATDAQIAGFIIALRQKGETTDELAGLVRAMHAAATPLDVPDHTIDIVGMGGAPSRRKAALNVSTMACFVAVAAGAVVCKHGNRKASSTSGAFDLLEVAGVNFDVSPEALEQLVRTTGLGFAFARTYHPAMRHVGPVRAELGIPTVFNTLGPLSHPGRVTRQVVGIADDSAADRVIDVLRATGSVHSWVVTGEGPLDELSTTGPTKVRQLVDGEITTITIDPAELGLKPPGDGELDGGDAQDNSAIMKRLFGGERGAVHDIVALNAGAGLVVAGVATDIAHGLELAADAIASGAASRKFDEHLAAAAE